MTPTIIDLHCLVLPGRSHLFDRVASSVEHYNKNRFINLIRVEGKNNKHMGWNRARAYAVGHSKYVACIDDDDYLIDDIDEAVEILESHEDVVGAYFDDIRVWPRGETKKGYTADMGLWTPVKHLRSAPHHICVMRRSAVMQTLDFLRHIRVFDLKTLHSLILSEGSLWHVPRVAYAWTQHGDQHHKHVRGWQRLHQLSIDISRPHVVSAHNRGLRQKHWPYPDPAF